MPKCVVCHEKPARIGRKFGYPADLICSQKCAVNQLMQSFMDFERCEVCHEWVAVCGGCSEEQAERIEKRQEDRLS